VPLVFAAIAPHGSEIIPELTDDPDRMARTRAAMKELGRRCARAAPDTVIVLTPHAFFAAAGAIAAAATKSVAGVLGGRPPARISAVFETDLELLGAIAGAARAQQVPLTPFVLEAKNAPLPLDWGALVPLWFVAHPLRPRPRVVVLAPDRSLPRETLVRSGVAIARAAHASNRRVALIASCDQGHAHDPAGPYGYDPAARAHDEAMAAAVAADDLGRLLDWDEAFLEAAKVDAYWQTLMLMGALGHTPMTPALLSYEAPTYFGMLVAAYHPAPSSAGRP
jgi:aromatic ring-opening dioxygenase LigB subunit